MCAQPQPGAALSAEEQAALDARLYEAAEGGDAAAVERLAGEGASADAKNETGYPAVVMAAREGHTEVVEALLRLGCDPNAPEPGLDFTALRLAVLQWGTLHHGRGLSSFNDLARLSTPSLSAKLTALDRSLYGGGAVAMAELGLIDALRDEPVPDGRADQADKLSLYPAS